MTKIPSFRTLAKCLSELVGRRSDVAVAFIGYTLLSVLTIELSSDGRNVATVWLADAIVLALLINTAVRYWSGILLAGWLANFLSNGMMRGWALVLILYGFINMMQTASAALLIRRGYSRAEIFEDVGSIVRFIIFAGLVAPFFGAIAGSLATYVIYGEPIAYSFLRWVASNSLGFLVGAPLFKIALDGSLGRCVAERSVRDRISATLLLCFHATVSFIVFLQSTLPLLFAPLSTLILLTFQLGRVGTVLGVAIIAVVGGVSSYVGHGPVVLIRADTPWQAIFFQFYMAIVLCTALPVAAAVSARKDALRRLALREQALTQILSNTADAVVAVDGHGICYWAEGRLLRSVAIADSEIVGSNIQILEAELGLDFQSMLVKDMSIVSDATEKFECVPLSRRDRTLEVSVGYAHTSKTKSGIVISIRDISDQKAREAEMTRQAETDDLTGVLNRKGFRLCAVRALEGGKSAISIAVFDIDKFKTINDSYGHAAGDDVIRGVAKCICDTVREGDDVGRLGGDEFAILVRGDIEVAYNVCMRLISKLSKTNFDIVSGVRVPVRISCGVSGFSVRSSIDELFAEADAALYSVKRAGGNDVRIYGFESENSEVVWG